MISNEKFINNKVAGIFEINDFDMKVAFIQIYFEKVMNFFGASVFKTLPHCQLLLQMSLFLETLGVVDRI